MRRVRAADLFCGAGGTSTGMVRACNELGLGLDLLAVNHWPVAIETHELNHPDVRHLCESLDRVNPREAIPGGRLDLLVASPECTHHSIARGGRPVEDQSRASAWHVLRWAEALRVDWILVENVPEFRTWGPIGVNGRPLKSRRGETYRAFIGALESLGYRVEDRLLNAADYGDPTTRERLFVLARRGNRRVEWPTPTHTEGGLFGKRWRPAREIIDWSLKGESIFTRKKPLAEKTLRRIEIGLRRFGGKAFILPHRVFQEMRADSIEKPLRTITAKSSDFALCEPFIIPFFGEREGQTPRTHSIDEPLPAVTSHGAGGLVEPFLTKYYGSGDGVRPISEPLDTITTKDRFALVTVEGEPHKLDIRFRMLQPHELAAAMSLEGYRFAGRKVDVVKQIGNAVPAGLAKALCAAALREKAGVRPDTEAA